jgi:parvulin-like peptidyl-prolyl isomerase
MLFIKNTLPAKLISIGVFLFLLLMINCSSSHSKKEQAEVLASIKEMQVTKTQFENAFREYYYRTGQVLNQDFNTKQAILNNEFNTYVLAAYAEDLGLDETEEALRKKEAIKRRVINEEFLNQVILSGIEVTEQELQEYYVRFNSQLRASHIYAESKEQINEYYSRLKAGESFDDLAKEAFTNKYMAENGGDIGRFTTDDLDIAFENASFALKIDEISEPVRTAQGYSIIKLTERVTKPILTEYEFAQQKPQLTSYVLKKKKELATRDHLLTFAETVLINEERLTALWNSISQNYEGMLNKDAEFLNGLNFEGKTLAGFQSFNLSMDDFLGEYLVSSPSMLNTIVDQQSLKEFIIGIAYRAYLFEQAELNGIDDQQIVQESIEETYYHFLADETNKYLAGTIQNTPAELYNTFLENEDNFAKPLEINLSRIVLNSEKDAVVVLEELSKGSSFESLVKKYTVNNEDRFVDGELGYRSIKDFGFNSNQLAELKIGDVTGIVQYQQGEYHIYKCLGRIESRSMVFSEARDLVDDFLTKKKLNVLRASTIDQVKEKHRAEINLQKLQELTIQI